jgi:hypothetical protein
MQDQPDQTALSMGDGPDSLIMSQSWDATAMDDLEDAPFGLYCGVGGLVEKAPHVAVALRRPVAVVHACTFLAGQVPAHEESCPAEGKVAAVAPTSAMTCCAESSSAKGAG